MYTKTIAATLLCAAAALTLPGCEELNGNQIKGGNIDRELPTVETDEDDEIETAVFDEINLDAPGLEKVKSHYQAGETYLAAYELREYWKTRTGVFNPNVDLLNTVVSANEQNIADQALEYRFRVSNFSETNPDGSGTINGDETFWNFKSGDEIDWSLNDDKASANSDGFDQEWLYQKHRHQWMEPQAKAYWVTKNEDYILNWIEVYSDWMENYPIKMESMPVGGSDNFTDYEWKGLQVAERVLTQLNIIPYYIQSENFTPGWLTTVLHAFHQSVEQMRLNYYADGNILITQAQAVAYAGILMPEFKKAPEWAEEGCGKLEAELDQFNEDGVHCQLDPSYHIAAIADYVEITNVLNANFKTDLMGDALNRLEDAMTFVADLVYPDWTIDNWNDTRSASYTKNVLKRNFASYMTAFPSNRYFQYMATEGTSGSYPSSYVSNYPVSGYYIMRNGWNSGSTMMVLKNCYDELQEWHNQPDNGTFSIWHKGRNFFPDAGVYAYSGSTRSQYAATTNHNTATIGTSNYSSSYRKGEFVASETINGTTEVLVTNHEMSAGVNHRRSVFFVERKFFVVVDEITGATDGPIINLHFHMPTADGAETLVYDNPETGMAGAHTTFADGNNMICRTFLEAVPAAGDYNFKTLSSNYSNAISTVSGSRAGYRVGQKQPSGGSARFITVICPLQGVYGSLADVPTEISARFTDNTTGGPNQIHNSSFSVRVSIDGTEYPLSYSIRN